MSDYFSVFVVLSPNVIEMCFSRNNNNYSNDSDEKMNVSQLLLIITMQFILQISQLDRQWKKWMFFVVTSAIGEGFRIDSCRDYPREKFTGVNIENFLANEYDLIANILNRSCSLRIDPIVKKNFFTLVENQKLITNKITKYSLPLTNNYQEGKIRTLDLKLIMKRTTIIIPTLKQVQTWIMTWNPMTDTEFNRLINESAKIENANIAELPPFLSSEEILTKGWTNYRETSLEQPWGLICPKCKMTYKANIFAKTCYSCQTLLKRA
jgi:hypothetical protein